MYTKYGFDDLDTMTNDELFKCLYKNCIEYVEGNIAIKENNKLAHIGNKVPMYATLENNKSTELFIKKLVKKCIQTGVNVKDIREVKSIMNIDNKKDLNDAISRLNKIYKFDEDKNINEAMEIQQSSQTFIQTSTPIGDNKNAEINSVIPEFRNIYNKYKEKQLPEMSGTINDYISLPFTVNTSALQSFSRDKNGAIIKTDSSKEYIFLQFRNTKSMTKEQLKMFISTVQGIKKELNDLIATKKYNLKTSFKYNKLNGTGYIAVSSKNKKNDNNKLETKKNFVRNIV